MDSLVEVLDYKLHLKSFDRGDCFHRSKVLQSLKEDLMISLRQKMICGQNDHEENSPCAEGPRLHLRKNSVVAGWKSLS